MPDEINVVIALAHLAARTTLAFHMVCTTALALTPLFLASVPQTTPRPARGRKSAALMWCSAKTRLERIRPRCELRVRRVNRGRWTPLYRY